MQEIAGSILQNGWQIAVFLAEGKTDNAFRGLY